MLEARSASGQSVIATTAASIAAFAAAVDASAATTDGDASSSGSSTAGSRSSGGTEGGSTQPTPTPSPEPAPPEEPEPEPLPEPVTLDPLDSNVVIDVGGRPPTGTGASAEGERRPYGFGLRSYAWHGLNGSGRAEGHHRRDR